MAAGSLARRAQIGTSGVLASGKHADRRATWSTPRTGQGYPDPVIDTPVAEAQDEAVETALRAEAPSQKQASSSPGAVVSFGLAAIALGLLLGTGPIAIFPAVFAVLIGAWTRYRLSVPTAERGGKGMATAGAILGLTVGVLCVIVMAGSQAT